MHGARARLAFERVHKAHEVLRTPGNARKHASFVYTKEAAPPTGFMAWADKKMPTLKPVSRVVSRAAHGHSAEGRRWRKARTWQTASARGYTSTSTHDGHSSCPRNSSAPLADPRYPAPQAHAAAVLLAALGLQIATSLLGDAARDQHEREQREAGTASSGGSRPGRGGPGSPVVIPGVRRGDSRQRAAQRAQDEGKGVGAPAQGGSGESAPPARSRDPLPRGPLFSSDSGKPLVGHSSEAVEGKLKLRLEERVAAARRRQQEVLDAGPYAGALRGPAAQGSSWAQEVNEGLATAASVGATAPSAPNTALATAPGHS